VKIIRDLYLVQKRKRRSEEVYLGANKKGVYLTVKVTTNSTGVFCRKEEWKEENSTRLLVS